MREQAVGGTILNPGPDRRVELIADGVLVGDAAGKISFIGKSEEYKGCIPVRQAGGIIMPAMLDAHIHIAQWPIRGQFCEGVLAGGNGRLLTGLERNVFPEEGRDKDDEYARKVVKQFAADTLAQGVVGGAAYMTSHASATRIALKELGDLWSVGMVLMDQNCPEYLRTDADNLDRDLEWMTSEFGPRFLITDRFAVSVSSELRRRAAKLGGRLGLNRQTHLNEQRGEKDFVEKTLYPGAPSYTDVYRRDGLFDGPCFCAHCIWMREEEWGILRDCGCAVAHCPSSNALLGSGIMDLDEVKKRGIDWSICTDVGAGPSTSLLAELASFLLVHRDRHQTSAEEALWGVTLGAAKVLRCDGHMGRFAVGMDYSYVEVDTFISAPGTPGEPGGEDNSSFAVYPSSINRPCPDTLPGRPARGQEAESVITNDLLGLRDRTLPTEVGFALDRLAREGLEDQGCLQMLQTHLAENVERLENRVRRVVLKGVKAFVR